jgi:hypothetical protein
LECAPRSTRGVFRRKTGEIAMKLTNITVTCAIPAPIDRPRQVEYTWVSEATKGVESVVAVTFEARGDQTEVTLRHSGVPDDEMGLQHKEGWTWILSMLAERFASSPSASAST